MSEFVGHPVSEGIITHVAVGVDEHASAGQVREHSAGISSWHTEAKYSGRVNILPSAAQRELEEDKPPVA